MTGTQMRAVQDMILTNVATGYFPDGMVCERIFPDLSVTQYTGKIGRFGKAHLRIVNTVMGGKGKPAQIDTRVYSTDSYEIDEHGLFDLVTKRDYANVIRPFDAERDAVRAIQTLMFLGKEKSVADALTDTSVITINTTLAGADQFSDYNNSNPLDVVNTYKESVMNACGGVVNKLIFDWVVFNKLKYHPSIFTRLGFQFNQRSPLSLQNLADAFEVQEILVPTCRYNSSKDGQTDALAPVWGKHIVGVVAPPTAEVGQVSAGYHVVPSDSQPRKVYKSPDADRPGATKVIVTDDYDYALVNATEAAFVIKNAIA
jgi:hypothetical protein